MKPLILGLFLLSFNLYAAIEFASLQATTELIGERPEAHILAFEVKNLGTEYEVAILVHGDPSPAIYGCHYHGSEFACHQGGHHHLHKRSSNRDEFHAAEAVALARAARTLARDQQSLEDILSYKVWQTEAPGHLHKSNGHDYWIKVVTDLREIFQQCHIHSGQDQYSCHYRLSGESEPIF